jgi:hypothetical protein
MFRLALALKQTCFGGLACRIGDKTLPRHESQLHTTDNDEKFRVQCSYYTLVFGLGALIFGLGLVGETQCSTTLKWCPNL